MANIKELNGNLFDSSAQVLVNTINCVGVMGKGIAAEFKYRFPDMYEDYVDRCKQKRVFIGVPYLWKKSTPWVLNFPTKYHWKYPSKIEYIEKGLTYLSIHYNEFGINSIAFPKLGSNSGKLDWNDVKEVMYRHLKPLNLEIEIYHFDPDIGDHLFINLKTIMEHINEGQIGQKLDVSNNIAKLIFDGFALNKFKSMYTINQTKGIGDKTLQKLYYLAANKGPNKEKERQTSLNNMYD